MLLAPDALVFFGTGLSVPFLQLYFRQGFGLGLGGVGWICTAMMVAGALAQLAAPKLARPARSDALNAARLSRTCWGSDRRRSHPRHDR